MIETALADPLDRFPAVRSRDPDEVEDALIRTYGARRLSLPLRNRPLNVHANHWQSPSIGLSYCNYGGNAQVEFPAADFYRLQLPFRGGAEVRIDGTRRQISAGETPVVPAGVSLLNNFTAGYEQIVLRVDSNALTNKLAAMIGATPRRKLEFETVTHGDALAGLRRILWFFMHELDALGPDMPPIMLAELEQAVITSFLCSNPNNYSALLHGTPRETASWQVRRVEEYIEAHWHESITIEVLARVASTSQRSIFHHFKKCRGHSPMEFVKEVRLRHARRMLTAPGSDTSVTETAFACGFGNLGHFGRDYLERFGERPSETLRRGKL